VRIERAKRVLAQSDRTLAAIARDVGFDTIQRLYDVFRRELGVSPGEFKWGHPIRPQETTLAQVLKSAGYRTGHFGKWRLGSVQKDGLSTPGKCGFDEWLSAPNFFDLDPVLSDRGKAVEFKGDSSEITAELAVKFLRDCSGKKQPFLAVVWFGSPHAPHRALAEDRGAYADRPAGERDFLGEITAMDRAFARIRGAINDLGHADDTILWYCSDNGALPKLGSSGGRGAGTKDRCTRAGCSSARCSNGAHATRSRGRSASRVSRPTSTPRSWSGSGRRPTRSGRSTV
jgi:arylsulfatase A-like enzyme